MASGTGTCALCTNILVLLYSVPCTVYEDHSILNIYSNSQFTWWKRSNELEGKRCSDAKYHYYVYAGARVWCVCIKLEVGLAQTSLPCIQQQKSFLNCIRLSCIALTITRIIIERMKNMCSVSNICDSFVNYSTVDKMRIFATQLTVRFDGIHMQILAQLFYWPSAFVWQNSFYIKLNCHHSVRRKTNKWHSLAETQHPGSSFTTNSNFTNMRLTSHVSSNCFRLMSYETDSIFVMFC